MIGAIAGASWLFENPVSQFSSIFGKPQHTFHPHEFTGYCADDKVYKEDMPMDGRVAASSCPRQTRMQVSMRLTIASTPARPATNAPTFAAQLHEASPVPCFRLMLLISGKGMTDLFDFQVAA
ncbi:hypothetical protein [Bradyrhizobium sp. Rc2d]|uniref:hypothetical protein n=1 Tax=Bradyrhizobium sp. Rc2d TaxID=1855321 RepID=UPI001AECB536|nr:hypothetical protein [Bradyrhizobium sp. Rc2d]